MKTFNHYLGRYSKIFKETNVGGTAGDLGTIPSKGVAKKKDKKDVPKKIKH